MLQTLSYNNTPQLYSYKPAAQPADSASRLITCGKGLIMESITKANLEKSSQELADKAADKSQTGIRNAKESAGKAGGRGQSAAQQGFDGLNDMADQAREMLSNAADSVVSYTKKNPLQALAIAAASGALIYAALKAFRAYRD